MSAKVRQVVDSSSDSDTKKAKRRKAGVVLYGTVDKEPSPEIAETVKGEGCSSEMLKLPTAYQPHRGDIFQQHYVAHFVSSHDSCIHTWINHLPNLMSSPPHSPEVFAIRAATIAFYGKLSGREDLELEATRWYSRGLESQRKYLEAASQEKEHGLCTERAVCAAIMFSRFEAIICTSPVGWIHHFTAAVKLLELSGPKKCQNGLMHMFFRSMRIASVSFLLLNHTR
jgi:hypothetical protein